MRIETRYNVSLDLKFIEITKQEKLSFTLLLVPEGYNFSLYNIDVKSTIFYDYFLGEFYIRLADAGDKVYPHVLILPNSGMITLEEPLIFKQEVKLIIEPNMESFRQLVHPKWKVPINVKSGYPFMLKVRIEGVFYAL